MIRRTSGCLFVGLLGLLPQLGCANGPSHLASNSLLPQLGSSGEVKPSKEKGELPPDEAARTNLATAEAFEKNGHPIDALKHYEIARAADPRLDKKVCRNLARLYDQIGDAQRAMVEYKKCLLETPHDADLLNDIGYCQYQQGLYQEAERWFRKALDEAPKHQRATVNLGMTLGQLGESRYAEALETFQRVTTPAEAHVNMAFIYQTHGKRDDARRAYQKALELEPNLDLARRALAKLDAPPKVDEGVELAVGRPDQVGKEPVLPKKPEMFPGEAALKPETLYPVPSRATQGPPDMKQAALMQQERDNELAQLEEFVRKRQAEVANQQPPPEPVGTMNEGSSAKPQAAKQVLIGAPVRKSTRPANNGTPTAVSFE